MATAPSFENYLSVGNRVILYPEPHRKNSARYEAVIRGWQKNNCIILRLYLTQDRTIIFRENAECSFRFLHDGVACSADAYLIDWQASKRNPDIRISWPKSVRASMVRRDERIKCTMPGTLDYDGLDVPCEVQDLSIGGLGLTCTVAVNVGIRLNLSFMLPDGVQVEGLQLVVKNTRGAGIGNCYLGCAFEPPFQANLYGVEFYVSSTLMRMRGINPASPRILIIHENRDAVKFITAGLVGMGYDVAVMDNLMDGLFHARLTVPTVLLMQNLPGGVSALDACRLLRTSKGLSETPVFLFCERGALTSEKVLEAGGTGFIDDLNDAESLIERLARKVPAIDHYEADRSKMTSG